jgi:hypothetical protein
VSTVKDLSVLHDRHLHRSMLDDSDEEERAIETLTQEITQVGLITFGFVHFLFASYLLITD